MVWPQRSSEVRDDGMYAFTWKFDPETGAKIVAALTAKEHELWRNESPAERRTPQQRMAYALVELIVESQNDGAKGRV